MSNRKISLPKGFLESLSDKCRKELELKAREFEHLTILNELEETELNRMPYPQHYSNSVGSVSMYTGYPPWYFPTFRSCVKGSRIL